MPAPARPATRAGASSTSPRRSRRWSGADSRRRDRYEPNDDAGARAFTLWGRSSRIAATLDFWDDQIDVYRVRLRKGQTVSVSLHGPGAHGHEPRPLASRARPRVEGPAAALRRGASRSPVRVGPNEHFLHRARATGWYYVEVKLTTPGSGAYTLSIAKT